MFLKKQVIIMIIIQMINFLEVKSYENNYQVWSLKLENQRFIPSHQRSTHLCALVKFPLNEKRHIIKFQQLIPETNKPFVHHFHLTVCKNYKSYFDQRIGQIFDCQPDKPNDFEECQSRFLVTAKGFESLTLPEHVGLPIGEHDSTYFVMQVHFDNKDLESGIEYISSWKIYYTANLKKYDASSFTVAHSYAQSLIIPPNQSNFTARVICNAECLSEYIPDSGIQLFAYRFHAHSLAVAMSARHYRGSTELEPIAIDKFNFNYQEIIKLKKERKIYPNDRIILGCTYNSTTKKLPVYGGRYATDEMCKIYLYFYPKLTNSFLCSSKIIRTYDLEEKLRTLTLKESDSYAPIEEKKFDFMSIQNKTLWNEYELQVIRSMQSHFEQQSVCLRDMN